MTEQSTKLRNIIICALFVAITAILAQVTIPLPLVPITGQTLAVGLVATILGSRLGAATMVGYLALGATGATVFANMSGGFGVIVGPTGGFIIGFIAAAYLTGLILEKAGFNLTIAIIANLVGMVVTLAIGVVQLKYVANLSWAGAMAGGVTPFIIGGLLKAFLAAWLGILIRNRLISAGLLRTKKTKLATHTNVQSA